MAVGSRGLLLYRPSFRWLCGGADTDVPPCILAYSGPVHRLRLYDGEGPRELALRIGLAARLPSHIAFEGSGIVGCCSCVVYNSSISAPRRRASPETWVSIIPFSRALLSAITLFGGHFLNRRHGRVALIGTLLVVALIFSIGGV